MKIYIKRLHIPLASIKLFVFVGLIWAGLVGPFSSVLILKSIGATSSQIGAFSAIGAVISMVAQPLWGVASDKVGSPRRVLCLCLAASTVFFSFVISTERFLIAACLLLVDTFFRCCIVSLLDSHTMSETGAIPGMRYGYIRVAGSVFYGTVSLLYSRIISTFNVKAIMPISISIAVVAILYGLVFAKGIWEDTTDIHNATHVKKAKPHLKKDAIALFRNKLFTSYIIFVAFNAMAVNPVYTYMIDYITAVGGHAGDVPMINAIKCAVEIPFMIFTGAFSHRVDAKKFLLAGMGFSLVQMVGLVFSNTPGFVVLFLVLGTPGFVLCLAGKMQYLQAVVPESVRSTSFTIAGACEIGLGAIVGNYIGGFVSEQYGTRALALMELVSLCAAIWMLLIIFYLYRNKKERKNKGL